VEFNMETFVVNLPTDLKPFVDSQVAAGDYESADEFVQTLISEALLKRNRARVDHLLAEAQRDEAQPWTKQEVEDIREEIRRGVRAARGDQG